MDPAQPNGGSADGPSLSVAPVSTKETPHLLQNKVRNESCGFPRSQTLSVLSVGTWC